MINRDNFLECSYQDLINFARYRISRLHITSINAEDLVHTVLCRTLEYNHKHMINKAYLLQSISNASINIKRKDCAKYNPLIKPMKELEHYLKNSETTLDKLLEQENHLINKKYEKILFSVILEYLDEINASTTIRRLLDPVEGTFFAAHKTKDLANYMGLSPSTITNNITKIKRNILPEIEKRFRAYIEQNKRTHADQVTQTQESQPRTACL